jgi:sirohydrochlorin ferrochelatase
MTPPAAPATAPALIAVAHGTRDQAGVREIQRLVELVRQARPEVRVRLCWLELAEPLLREALPGIAGPVVAVPLLLSTGYHVKSDITEVLGDRPDTAVAGQLGPDARITAVVAARLREAGPVPGPGVALFASGSRDPEAAGNLVEVAAQLQRQLGCPVYPRFLTDKRWQDGLPAGVRVANYLLAPGHFNDQLQALARADLNLRGAPGPIGAHPGVVEVILDRYDEAARSLAA